MSENHDPIDNGDDIDTVFSRTTDSGAFDLSTLHLGKRTVEIGMSVTPEMKRYVEECARLAHCKPSDMACDALYAYFTGKTFLEHVADGRRSAVRLEPQSLPGN